MHDARLVAAADRSPRSRVGVLATPRRRALLACAIAALLVHGGLIRGIGAGEVGVAAQRAGAPVSVRTIAITAGPPVDVAPVVAEVLVGPAVEPAAPAPAPAVAPVSVRRKRRAELSMAGVDSAAEKAGARITAVTPAAGGEASNPAPPTQVSAVDVAPSAAAAPASLLAEGEQPPPVYRTRPPPSSTLHYQVRRGILHGTGEIRWQASGEAYRLTLEARIAGLTLLIQTSEGAIDANGLAPHRFLDQRARRPAQAANFRRDTDRITFSGPSVEWPLLPGSQDRLSWMIQLAGIAAAEPGLLVDGGRISMVVVGARGEAAVWTLRCAGREDVETAWGTLHAVKFVRAGSSAHDTHAEIWLDPARDYLPARATMRNGDGAGEYELLLERVEPAS